ncbi:MAG: hypothetical protein ACC742_07095 [Thermoanaerobaculales bacterium]
MRLRLLSLFVVALLFATPRPAYAYLDANTGSLLLQLLLGGVAGFALLGKLYWQRLKGFLGLQKSEDDADTS